MRGVRVSVVVPVYNDPEGLEQTLQSLSDTCFEERFEVLIVDNNSTDSTDEVINDYNNRRENFISLEETETQSSYAARNKGIKNAQGDIICFIDADMTVEDDYIQKVSDYFEQNGTEYLGCKVELENGSDSLTGIYGEKTGFPVETYIQEKNFAPTCCLSVRSEIFEDIGLFNKNLVSGGDKEFGVRAAKNGYNLEYTDRIALYHPTRNTPYALAKKYFRIGRGWYQKQIEHPGEFPNDRRPWYNFTYLLPWKPRYRKDKIEGWDKITLTEKMSFYFHEWIKNISMYTGYQYERFYERQHIISQV